jgi:hypothetical protein
VNAEQRHREQLGSAPHFDGDVVLKPHQGDVGLLVADEHQPVAAILEAVNLVGTEGAAENEHVPRVVAVAAGQGIVACPAVQPVPTGCR